MKNEPESYHRPPVSNIPKIAVPTCPACGAVERKKLLTVTEHEYSTTTDDDFTMMECAECGAWFLDPRPDKAALDIIYPPNYYVYAMDAKTQGEPRVNRGAFAKLSSWLFKQRIRPIARHMQLTPDSQWLDIGCGNGAVLDSMREAYGLVGTGLDFSESAVNACRARGFEAHVSRFEDYQPVDGKLYDLVHSSHVIEHVESPLAYMQKAHDLLKPGGLNVFITPNKKTWESRVLGKHWGGLHVPRHWAILDPKSAKALGDQTGFEYLDTCFSTNGTFWTWSFHSALQGILGRRLSDWLFPSDHRFVASNLWNITRIGGFSMIDLFNAKVLHQSSNMLVIFRKPLADNSTAAPQS